MSFALHRYGIRLRRIEFSDIELIRHHRNKREIRGLMRYQRRISKRKQRKWFEGINNYLNYYFMIEVQEKQIGLINCKDVDLKKEVGEGGIFIWDPDYIGTPYPLLASVLLIDFLFNILKIGKTSVINILPTNVKAINYNKFLGYKVTGNNPDKSVRLTLTKEDFNEKLPKLIKACHNFSDDRSDFHMTGVESEINHPKINELLRSFDQNIPD